MERERTGIGTGKDREQIEVAWILREDLNQDRTLFRRFEIDQTVYSPILQVIARETSS